MPVPVHCGQNARDNVRENNKQNFGWSATYNIGDTKQLEYTAVTKMFEDIPS